MPDFVPIANQVNVPDPNQAFSTLGNILGLKQKKLALQQQAQALQTGQYAQQSAQAGAQEAQQGMQERQKLQTAMKAGVDDQGKSLYNDQNEIDPDKVAAFATRALPMTGQAVVQNILKTKADKTALSGAVADLNGKYRGDVAGIVRQSFNNPKANSDQIMADLQDYAKQNPQAAAVVLAAQPLVKHIDTAQDMKSRNDMVQHLFQVLQPASKTAEETTPTTENVDTGAQIQQQNVNKLTGERTPVNTLNKSIPPGYTMINGQLVRADQGGLSLPTVRNPSGPAPPAGGKLQGMPAPGVNANPGDVQRYNSTMEENRKHVQDVSGAANDTQNGVGSTRYRNDQILSILQSTNASPTGPGAHTINYLASKLPGNFGGQYADNYQKLGHYLAQNSAAIATKMGVPGTNQGAAQADAAAGNTEQGRNALTEVTKVNDAMNTALDMYNRGLAKVSQNGADPSKVAAYRQAFGQNFDVNVLRYDDAVRRGDKKEIDVLKNQLGAQGLKQMGAKRKVLHSLAENGDLP